MIEDLKDPIKMCHPGAVAVKEVSEHVLAIDQLLMRVVDLRSHFAQKICLHRRKSFQGTSARLNSSGCEFRHCVISF